MRIFWGNVDGFHTPRFRVSSGWCGSLAAWVSFLLTAQELPYLLPVSLQPGSKMVSSAKAAVPTVSDQAAAMQLSQCAKNLATSLAELRTASQKASGPLVAQVSLLGKGLLIPSCLCNLGTTQGLDTAGHVCCPFRGHDHYRCPVCTLASTTFSHSLLDLLITFWLQMTFIKLVQVAHPAFSHTLGQAVISPPPPES